jgi:hypothetical protein
MSPLKLAFTLGGVAALFVPKELEKSNKLSLFSGTLVAMVAGFLIAQEGKHQG